MGEREKRILDELSDLLQKLTDQEKDWLLAFGEGMAFKSGQQEAKRTGFRIC